MKTVLRVALSSLILFLACWVSSPEPALAGPTYCEDIQGRSCQSPGATWTCLWEGDGDFGSCTCQTERFWRCTYPL
jgi:hypothetical protein